MKPVSMLNIGPEFSYYRIFTQMAPTPDMPPPPVMGKLGHPRQDQVTVARTHRTEGAAPPPRLHLPPAKDARGLHGVAPVVTKPDANQRQMSQLAKFELERCRRSEQSAQAHRQAVSANVHFSNSMKEVGRTNHHIAMEMDAYFANHHIAMEMDTYLDARTLDSANKASPAEVIQRDKQLAAEAIQRGQELAAEYGRVQNEELLQGSTQNWEIYSAVVEATDRIGGEDLFELNAHLADSTTKPGRERHVARRERASSHKPVR